MRSIALLLLLSVVMPATACFEKQPEITPANQPPSSPSEMPRRSEGAVTSEPPPSAATADLPPPSATIDAPPAPPPPPPLATSRYAPLATVGSKPLLRADLASTTVADCDEYLARVEICTNVIMRSLPDQSGTTRILDALDLSRRTWQRAARTSAGRENLVDACATSLRMYNSAVARTCPPGTQ